MAAQTLTLGTPVPRHWIRPGCPWLYVCPAAGGRVSPASAGAAIPRTAGRLRRRLNHLYAPLTCLLPPATALARRSLTETAAGCLHCPSLLASSVGYVGCPPCSCLLLPLLPVSTMYEYGVRTPLLTCTHPCAPQSRHTLLPMLLTCPPLFCCKLQ